MFDFSLSNKFLVRQAQVFLEKGFKQSIHYFKITGKKLWMCSKKVNFSINDGVDKHYIPLQYCT